MQCLSQQEVGGDESRRARTTGQSQHPSHLIPEPTSGKSPVSLLASELRQQLIGQQDVRGFVVDGFPRDVHQAMSFQEQVQTNRKAGQQ